MERLKPFGQLRPLRRVAILLGLLILTRPNTNSQACKYALSHCMIVRVNACTAAPWREQERIRRRAACVAGQLNNTWSLAVRAPMFCIACRAGLFSHN